LTDPRLKIAVFVDFDNIEIGVKTTLGGQFDIGLILEAIKERGEVVTKIAYGDWKRAGDHGRLLSQHAIRMVQRNPTPGGDKNGADINLALDALEMAFTHDHINAFVIVGGDSDFITLVEKLKQYDRKVFVVGGRQFTSLVMQRNCHEFIAYENLLGTRRGGSTGGGGGRARGGAPAAPAPADVEKAFPLVKRALKVLSDREVTPQLGLLKSTLLQLDSTFSERDYGTGTFRDFIEKVAERGLVSLKQAGRSVLVELADNAVSAAVPDAVPTPAAAEVPAEPVVAREPSVDNGGEGAREPAEARTPAPEQTFDAVRTASRLFGAATQPPRWPMYIRQVRQYLRAVDESFDERKFGFAGIVEFLRACQKDGLLRLDRDRQGVLRVFPGPQFPQPSAQPAVTALEPEAVMEGRDLPPESPTLPAEAEEAVPAFGEAEPAPAVVVDEGDAVVEGEVTTVSAAESDTEGAPMPGTRKRTRSRTSSSKKTATKSARPRRARKPQ
jgi:NYN domain/OST-HTH/LOTUS domain